MLFYQSKYIGRKRIITTDFYIHVRANCNFIATAFPLCSISSRATALLEMLQRGNVEL